MGEKKRVLIIDDDEAVRVTLRLILEDFEVVEAGSAEEAIECLEQVPDFDVVICDLVMPGLTGAELYDGLSGDVPAKANFIFATGGFLPRVISEFVERVKPRIMHKPFGVEDVKAAVASVLG